MRVKFLWPPLPTELYRILNIPSSSHHLPSKDVVTNLSTVTTVLGGFLLGKELNCFKTSNELSLIGKVMFEVQSKSS